MDEQEEQATKLYKFQYFSDVHTEFYLSNPGKVSRFGIQAEGEYLILAGDVGNPFTQVYKDFLGTMSKMFKLVLLVSGNHEYYKSKHSLKCLGSLEGKKWIDAVDEKIRSVCAEYDNVVFLQNETFTIPNTNILIYGGTFWTDIDATEEEYIVNCVQDYKQIPGFSVSLSRELHGASIKGLQNALAVHCSHDSNKVMVVISHHLPSYELIHPMYRGSTIQINSAFASNVREAENERVVAWVAGHTHCPINLGKFYVNPKGYPGENAQTEFSKTFMI